MKTPARHVHPLRPRVVPGLLAVALAIAAAVGFGLALDGYSHAAHPLGLLGARGVPGALAFNLTGFVLPGSLVAWAALSLRGRLPADARWSARLGCWLLLISALGFAMQGLLQLDPADLEAPASRLHASAWTLWWVAGIPGAVLLGAGLRGAAWRPLAGTAVTAATLLLAFGALPPLLLPGPIGQRIALLAWLALAVAAALAPRRQP